jgi:Right handed beta helix region
MTIRGNMASLVAGGVRGVGGTLTIADSTVSGNQAGSNFPGIQQFGGSAFIANSTISDNQTTGNVGGGAGASNGATMTIESSTITNNRIGGIRASDAGTVVNVKNTVVSDNTPDDCDTAVSGGTIASQGNNLSSDDSCGFTLPTDQEDTDPLLDLLADNGGPTDTHALLTGSPAVDEGGSDQAEDQRGVTRPQDGDGDGTSADDVGAFELEAADTAPKITPLSPNPGSKTKDRTPRIKAKVTDSQTDLAKGDITLRLDGNNKGSFSYSASSDQLSFRSKKLKEGRKHTVKVTATDGSLSSSKSWKFTVKEKKKK